MIYFVILYLTVMGVVLFIFVRALFMFFNVKEYFWNALPDSEKEWINGFPNGLPRHPISKHYMEHPLPWAKETVNGLLKRNGILSKCDKEKAEKLFLSEKQMFYSWNTAVIATVVFALLYWAMK